MNTQNIKIARKEIQGRYPNINFPEQSYLVLYSARSGSNLLCMYLEKAGIGKPREAFNPNTSNREHLNWGINYNDPAEYIQTAITNQTLNGVMGMKLSIPQFTLFLTTVKSLFTQKDLSDSEIIETIFPDVKYIHIQRKDKVKQAISFSKAKQNGIWFEKVGADTSYKDYVTPAVYDREHIECSFDELLMEDVALDHYLQINQLPHVSVWYEDLAENPHNILNEIHKFLEVSGDVITNAPLRKQSNATSKDWENQFRGETPWLNNKDIKNALSSGDLLVLSIARSIMITSHREQKRYITMPSMKYRWFRKWFVRGKRKISKTLNSQHSKK